MTIIKTLADLSRRASVVLAVCTLAMATSCAPADDDGSNEGNHSQFQDAVSIGDEDDISSETKNPEIVDKAIKNNYCCAEKKGNRVKSCSNTYEGFVEASLQCHTTVTDNVLRNGTCDSYRSCDGKTRNRARPPQPGDDLMPPGSFLKEGW